MLLAAHKVHGDKAVTQENLDTAESQVSADILVLGLVDIAALESRDIADLGLVVTAVQA